jgi:hypothetical protein
VISRHRGRERCALGTGLIVWFGNSLARPATAPPLPAGEAKLLVLPGEGDIKEKGCCGLLTETVVSVPARIRVPAYNDRGARDVAFH